VELQERLVARLKDIQQFQGAYYELVVANCLLRAGFELELEDEQDQSRKHCEFAARSKQTGKKYWIEAKMRSVAGVLGKSTSDSTRSSDPTSRMTVHLREALAKPADDERMIFIDLNAEPTGNDVPSWLDKAVKRLESREVNLGEGQAAYVFVTNMAFHWVPNAASPQRELLAHGLGISDFGKPGMVRLSTSYRQKQKHIDAHRVIDAFKTFPQIPETFDGQPQSDALRSRDKERIRIGETYNFTDVDGGVTGTVTSAIANEVERKAYIAIATSSGQGMILTEEMSDAEIEDYKKYGEAFFGGEKRHHKSKDIFELYEFLVNCYSKSSKEQLIELAADFPHLEELKNLDHGDLVLEVCEVWAGALVKETERSRP
jgi:hypothetical protein